MRVAERFEIESLIGKGGMGAVYRAHDLATGVTIALKLVADEGSRASERFAREARLLCSLQHPRIVRYIAHGRSGGQRYLAMEWLEGEDLAARLKRTGLSAAEAVGLTIQLAEALSVVHAHGIVHRDIKPSNLILPEGDLERVKLIDFGVARPVLGSPTLTIAGDAVGTPNYMSPEQARGDADVDVRADLFSLGCVFFECLTGRPPFSAASALAVMTKILFQEPPRLSEIVPELAPLDELCARLMAKHREQRPASAQAVVAELRALPPVAGAATAAEGMPKALTTSERRLVCIVLASPAERNDDSWDIDPARTLPPEMVRLGEQHQAQIETLRDQSVVALLSSAGSATDLAARAAHCALAMRGRLTSDLGIALATGRAVMSSLRLPIGDIIDRAAALLGGAGRHVRIDEVTAGLLDTRFEVAAASGGRLELIGVGDSTGSQRRLLGKPTLCVGREREIAVLEGLMAEAIEEPGARAAVLIGPAGIGKSRLGIELARRQRERLGPFELWIGRGDPMGAGSPFGLMAHALRGAFGLLDGEALPVRRAKLLRRVARSLPAGDRARVCEFLGELVGTPFPQAESVQLRAAHADLGVMGDQIRRAWEDFVHAEAARGPVVLLLEDLHWGDLPTVKLVDRALSLCADRPLFVLAMARPEIDELFPALWRERGAQELRIHPLSRKAAGKLVRAVLPAGADPTTVGRIVEQAAGNAFYLEELIRQVAEGHGDELPGTVLAMLQARLEALPDAVRRVLRAASVFGQTFWTGGVAALIGEAGSSARVSECLEILDRQEIVSSRAQTRFPGEIEHVFRHALVREAAYAMLTDRDRRLGHRLAAEWLGSRGELDPQLLADHHERGDEPARAIVWHARAAEQALEGNDLAAARARAQRGIDLGATGPELGRLCLIHAEVHRWRGEWADAEARAHEAVALLPRGSGAWSGAVDDAALASRVLDHLDRLFALVAEARAAPPEAEPGPSVVLKARLAALLYYSGRYRTADELLAELAPQGGGGDPAVAAMVHYARGLRAAFAGRPEEALRESEIALAGFEAAGNLRRACNMQVLVAANRLGLGDHTRAAALVRAAIVTADGMGLHNVAVLGRQVLGVCIARSGNLAHAAVLEREAAQAFQVQGDRRLEGTSRRYLAQMLLALRERTAAAREATAAVEILAALPPSQVPALATLAEVHLAEGRVGEALAHAREAQAALDSLGSIADGDGYARLVHARVLLAAGERTEGLAALAAAHAHLLARAETIEDPSLRQSFLAGVPEHAETITAR